MIAAKRWSWWLTVFILALIVGVALWLRWLYASGVNVYVDEYITLRAARQILERGVPLLPTGNFYSHGLLLSYVEAVVMRLVGFDPLAARLPVLLISVLTVILTWWVGRRWFSASVGLLAAALLALTPDAIIWGGRARMYAPLQFLTLLALFFYWRVVARHGTWCDSALFALSFLGAMFLHAEAMVLLPVLVLVAVGAAWPELRQKGLGPVLRHWWQTGLIVAWLVAALGVLAELWFRRLGPPMVSRLAEGIYGPSGRAYVQPAWDWSGIQKTLEPLLTSPIILAMVGLLLVGLVYWLFRHRQTTDALLPEGWGPPLAYLGAILGLTLLVLLFLADPSWKSSRYLFVLLPVFYLSLAAGLFVVLGQSPILRQRAWLVLSILLVSMAIVSGPAAWSAAHEEVAGYDRAFEYLAEHWRPGDAVMTFVPQAALFHLGQADYLSVPTDYRGFAYEQEGHWLEGWDSIPMVDSGVGVAAAVATQDHLWFVVDEHRLHARFATGFAQAIWDNMDLVWRDHQVMVFRTADPVPPQTRSERKANLGSQVTLEGYAFGATPQPGADLPLTLYWSATGFPAGNYSTFVHLVDTKGTGWAQDDGPPLGEVYPTTCWWPGEIVRDRKLLHLPANIPPGIYRLDAGMYDPATMAHLPTPDGSDRVTLGFVRVGEPEHLPSDLVPVDAVFGDQVRLLGFILAPASDRTWKLTLAWTAETPPQGDYTVFVHLVDDVGNIQGQHDGPPGGGFYPTSFWTPDETVLDYHDLALPADSPAGTYRLLVGLYQPETGERLQTKVGDSVELKKWTIP